MSISTPTGWSIQDTSRSELDFKMTGPASYQFQPTTTSITAPWPTDSERSAAATLDRAAQGYNVVVTTAAQACSVGRDSAAFLSFSAGADVGYIALWLHFGDFYVLWLVGKGGVDTRAILDAKAILASVTYSRDLLPPA